MLRTRSLESGATPRRLNQVLFPDPGKPIARTTVPFEGPAGACRGEAAAGEWRARGWGACLAAGAASAWAGSASATSSGTPDSGAPANSGYTGCNGVAVA